MNYSTRRKFPFIYSLFFLTIILSSFTLTTTKKNSVKNSSLLVELKVAAKPKTAESQKRPGSNKLTGSNNSEVPQMIYVQGGSFNMGSNTDDDDAKPAHRVTLRSYYIGKYEISVADFRKFINSTRYQTTADQEGSSFIWTGTKWQRQNGVNWEYDSFGSKRPQNQDTQPVVHVSWDDASRYCQWLSSQTGKTYLLPTEAEWEYAARGGSKSNGNIFSGSNDLSVVAWYKENSNGQIHEPGQKQANELGIFDMTGNVWEWCRDWYDKYYYTDSPAENPQGPPTGSFKVYRGGSWNDPAKFCRVTYRSGNPPGKRFSTLGFRVVLIP